MPSFVHYVLINKDRNIWSIHKSFNSGRENVVAKITRHYETTENCSIFEIPNGTESEAKNQIHKKLKNLYGEESKYKYIIDDRNVLDHIFSIVCNKLNENNNENESSDEDEDEDEDESSEDEDNDENHNDNSENHNDNNKNHNDNNENHNDNDNDENHNNNDNENETPKEVHPNKKRKCAGDKNYEESEYEGESGDEEQSEDEESEDEKSDRESDRESDDKSELKKRLAEFNRKERNLYLEINMMREQKNKLIKNMNKKSKYTD